MIQLFLGEGKDSWPSRHGREFIATYPCRVVTQRRLQEPILQAIWACPFPKEPKKSFGSDFTANCTFGKECWQSPVFKLHHSRSKDGSFIWRSGNHYSTKHISHRWYIDLKIKQPSSLNLGMSPFSYRPAFD